MHLALPQARHRDVLKAAAAQKHINHRRFSPFQHILEARQHNTPQREAGLQPARPVRGGAVPVSHSSPPAGQRPSHSEAVPGPHVSQAMGQRAGAPATILHLQSLCLDLQPIKPHARGQVQTSKLCLSYISKRTETAEHIFFIFPKGLPIWEECNSTKQFVGKLQTSENGNSE